MKGKGDWILAFAGMDGKRSPHPEILQLFIIASRMTGEGMVTPLYLKKVLI